MHIITKWEKTICKDWVRYDSNYDVLEKAKLWSQQKDEGLAVWGGLHG